MISGHEILGTHRRGMLLSVVALSLTLAGGCQMVPDSPPPLADVIIENDDDIAYQNIELLTEVMMRVRRDYVDVDEVEYQKLVYSALKGMLRSLDPHSQFMEPVSYEDMQEGTSGVFGGIGIMIGVRNNGLTVISPLEDTPAFRIGLQAGDRIVKIEGESTRGWTVSQAVDKLRGQVGDPVTLTFLRLSPRKEETVTLTRDAIKLTRVKGARIIEDGIGYIRVTQFSATTVGLLQKELDNLEADGMTGLVLDLRNNPGGLLKAAIQVSELFLENGKLVVLTRSRKGRPKSERRNYARGKAPRTELPMVILVNAGSASASEIVAGALQDHRRAILVGQKTFGKGSVQTIIPMKDGSALRLTTAKYYTPSEKVIHENGIEPDIVVPMTSEEWRNVQRKMMRDENAAYYDEVDPGGGADLSKVVDHQLARGVDLLKALRLYQSKGQETTVTVLPAEKASVVDDTSENSPLVPIEEADPTPDEPVEQ